MIEVFGERMYTTAEVAEMFQVHPNTVRVWCDTGKLERKVIAGRAYHTEESLRAFFNNTNTNRKKRSKSK